MEKPLGRHRYRAEYWVKIDLREIELGGID
jgi:hypothetical protein